MSEKIVGIAGGMGPQSTLDLMQKILVATPARCEQDHIHLIVDSNPKTPDRTQAILGTGDSPAETLCEAVRRLTRAGADLILIPCNTAHAFLDEVQAATSAPIFNMVDLCARWAAGRYRRGEVLGLLATTGTLSSGLYERALGAHGLAVIAPSPPEQEDLMEAIYGAGGIKMGHVESNAAGVRRLGRALVDRGARAVIAACTEVGLVLADCDLPVIDPLRILAEEAVRQVKGEAREKE